MFEMNMPFMPDDLKSGGVLSGSSGNQNPEKAVQEGEGSDIKT